MRTQSALAGNTISAAIALAKSEFFRNSRCPSPLILDDLMYQLQASQSLPLARPYCPECSAPMIIVVIEPDGPGPATPSFECPVCRLSYSVPVRC
jgi:hypothetical protein